MVVKCDNCGNRYEWDKSNKCPYCGQVYDSQKGQVKLIVFIVLFIPIVMLITSIPEILDRYFLNPQKYDGITQTQWKQILLVLIFVLLASFRNVFYFLKYRKTKEAQKNGNKNKY